MVEKDDLTNDNGENNPETGDKNEQKEGDVFEMRLNVKIPDERVGVLIGKNGSVKKYIQEETGTIIDIDTTGEGPVILSWSGWHGT
ncbi:MAG: KH domain-containing protein [Candidatus Hodarchaeales archaeon]